VRIDAIVIDCRDAAPLARFWAEALGWRVAPYDDAEIARLAALGVDDVEDDPSVLVEPFDDDDADLPRLFFTEVAEPKVVKNRVHVDVVADHDLEVRVAVARPTRPTQAADRRLDQRALTKPRGKAYRRSGEHR